MDIFTPLWNRDPSQAPKSYDREVETSVGGKTKTKIATKYIYIWAALQSPQVVSRTRWLPDEGRWEGMTRGQEPLAWLPYEPEYPL